MAAIVPLIIVAIILLIVIGLLLVTHYFTWLASYLQALTPSALRSHI